MLRALSWLSLERVPHEFENSAQLTHACTGAAALQPVDGVSSFDLRAAVVMGLVHNGRNTEIELSQQYYCAARLAEQHIVSRDGSIVAELSHVLIRQRFSIMPFDTNGTESGGASAVTSAFDAACDYVIGSESSLVSRAVAAATYGRVQISPTATSSALSNSILVPNFFRMVPSNAQTARACVQMLRALFWTLDSFAVLHVGDEYGMSVIGSCKSQPVITL